MIEYYEVQEVFLSPDSSETPEFIRMEITGMSQAEKDAVLADMRDIMTTTNYRTNLHYCYHDENPIKSCQSVEV